MRRIHLLVIDPQNDFCDVPESAWPIENGQRVLPALPINGANEDMQRLACFIDLNRDRLSAITVTLDSHPYMAIERTTFWTDAQGQAVAPFTQITDSDVEAGRYVPANHKAKVIRVLSDLHKAGQKALTVWPVHCVTGTWGHNIHPSVSSALNRWEQRTRAPVMKAMKGEYFLTEHYGAFQAEVPLIEVESTLFNHKLAKRVTDNVDVLIIAGEASSHCVAASLEQLEGYLTPQSKRPQIVLLTDCMSPVQGFEEAQVQLFERMAAAGATLCTTKTTGSL